MSTFAWKLHHFRVCTTSVRKTDCLDLDLNDQKTRGYFWQWFHVLKKWIKIRIENGKKSCEPFWRAALTGHGQSSQSANFWKKNKNCQLTQAWNLKFFWAKWLHLKCYESAILWVYPKCVSGSVHVHIHVDKSE